MNLDMLSQERLAQIRRIEQMTRNFAAGFAALREPFLNFGKALNQLGKLYFKHAERAYRAAHGGKLPGSTRTARLRKKRRDAVLRWARENWW